MKYILDITNDTAFYYKAKLSLIPSDCTRLYVIDNNPTSKFYHHKIFNDEKTLSSYALNEKLKTLKKLDILDLSGCKTITNIWNGFSNLSISTLILPPNVCEMPNVYYCPHLTTIIGPGLTVVKGIIGCPLLENIEYNKNLVYISVPNTNLRKIDLSNIEKISTAAFENCSNLVEVKLSPKLTEIGFYAFKNCSSLYSVEIPDAATICPHAFSGCMSLKRVKLPKDLRTIEEKVFFNCVNLDCIIGGDCITQIKKRAFFNCKCINHLPFNPTITDSEAFENTNENLCGIVLSTGSVVIIWCFDTLSFFYYPKYLDSKYKNKIVNFSPGSRISLENVDHGIDIKWTPYQVASNLALLNAKDIKIENIFHDGDNKRSKYVIRKELLKFEKLPSVFPTIVKLQKKMIKRVEALDISNIIDSYSTYASEFQTWKVGGDNTFYHIVKTSIDYKDAYIETLLPTIDEEYSESACHNYSDEIDTNIQSKYKESDVRLKRKAHAKYDKNKHIETLVNDYITSYIRDYADIQNELCIELAKRSVAYFFQYIYRHYELKKSLSIICDGSTPPLDYENWLRTRQTSVFG